MTFELKDTTIRSELVVIELKPTVSLSLSDISFPLKVFIWQSTSNYGQR